MQNIDADPARIDRKAPNKLPFTDAWVKKLAPPLSGQETHYDQLIESFGLRVSAGGAKTWIVQRRVEMFDHKSETNRRVVRRFKLGRYPLMPLSAAREAARSMLLLIEAGNDPKEQQEREREERRIAQRDTFGHIRDRFLDEYEGRNDRALRPKTRHEYGRLLRTEFKEWEQRPISDIEARDVNEAKSRLKRTRGGCIANRAFAVLRKMMNWAVSETIIKTAPTAGLKRPAIEKARERALHERELFYLWQAFAAAPVFAPVFKLLLITAQRREEVRAMRWSELENLDGVNPMWRIPRQRAKNDHEQLVPLSPLAVSILKSIPRSKSEFVFTTMGKSPVSGFSKAKVNIEKALVAAGAAMPNWRIHDFRRTAATLMAECGAPRDVVEKILNHNSGTRGGVAGVYNRSELLAERRVALELWATYLQRVTAECMDDRAIESLRTEHHAEYMRRLSGGLLQQHAFPLRLVVNA